MNKMDREAHASGMRPWRTTLLGSMLLATIAVCLASDPVSGQDADFEPPTTSWGDPEIGGIWDFRSLTPLERPRSLGDKVVFTDAEAEQFRQQVLALRDFDRRPGASIIDVEGAYNNFWWDWGDELTEDKRTSLIVDPHDGRLPPLTAAAEALLAAQRRDRQPPVRDLVSLGANRYGAEVANSHFDGPEYLGLSERCLVGFNAGPPMMPSAYNNNVRVLQTPDYVVLVNEMIHDARIVPLDGRPHLPPDMRRWMGDSLGHWEGSTLVVDTTNFTDKTPTFQTLLGSFGSGKGLHLTERFTRIAKGRLLYEFTVDAPATFTRPFSAAMPMKATEGPIYEYACHEGNYAIGAVLRGARFQEKQAEESASRP